MKNVYQNLAVGGVGILESDWYILTKLVVHVPVKDFNEYLPKRTFPLQYNLNNKIYRITPHKH